MECNIQGLNFTRANIYFPCSDFDRALNEMNVKCISLIIGGDSNMNRNIMNKFSIFFLMHFEKNVLTFQT